MKRSYGWLIVALLLSVTITTVQAQYSAKVQEFYSLITVENPFVYFDLFDMQEGQTIYLYVESEELDTRLILCDISCETVLAENDDIDYENGNYNSALEYTFEADEDYSIAITDCCDETAEGVFHLLIGFNAPDVLEGTAEPNGAEIAVPFADTYTDLTTEVVNSAPQVQALTGEPQVQEFIGKIGRQNRYTYYDIFAARKGETLYVYVESDEIDPYVIICDIDCVQVFAENDDIDAEGNNYNSAIEYTFPADGDYTIAVADCCDENATGAFRLLLGYGDSRILQGIAEPTGAQIAVRYVPPTGR